MPSLRSPNLASICLEDVFDQTPAYAVVEISAEINYLVEKYASHGVSAQTLYVIFSFYANSMMEVMIEDVKKRVADKEKKE